MFKNFKQIHLCNEENLQVGFNKKISLTDCKAFSIKGMKLDLTFEASSKIEKSYKFLLDFSDQQRIPIYGLNTQFGDQVNLVDIYLNHDVEEYHNSVSTRQSNLIKSHACGLGVCVSPEAVKVAMLLRTHCLTQGYSGISNNTISSMIKFINAGIIPQVHRYGSIGASGDLIPLATIAAAMAGGDVDVLYQGKVIKASEALYKAKLKPIEVSLRDGLALINGTSFMTSIASLAVYDLIRVFTPMLAAIAMALESMLVIESGYDPIVHSLKNHIGSIKVNNFMLKFWEGSTLLSSLDELRTKSVSAGQYVAHQKTVQDYYSVRSVPQGFGPFVENLENAIRWIEEEINAVSDNPIIDYDNKKIHHGANFMGYYITDACDILKINIAQASSWIHALLANLVHPRKNHGLPTNLIANPEKFNGFRPIQLLAASIAVQNRKFAQAQQSYMIPTEGDNQDVNSLGTHAALDLREAVDNLERLVAILLMASTQALSFRDIKKASQNAQKVSSAIREVFPDLNECRLISKEINNVIGLIHDGKIQEVLTSVIESSGL